MFSFCIIIYCHCLILLPYHLVLVHRGSFVRNFAITSLFISGEVDVPGPSHLPRWYGNSGGGCLGARLLSL